MPFTKRYYIEITTLEKIDNDHFYEIINRNFEKSFIKLRIFDTLLHEKEQHATKNKQISIL